MMPLRTTTYTVDHKLMDGETLDSAYHNADQLRKYPKKQFSNYLKLLRYVNQIPVEIAHQFILTIEVVNYIFDEIDRDITHHNLDEWKEHCESKGTICREELLDE